MKTEAELELKNAKSVCDLLLVNTQEAARDYKDTQLLLFCLGCSRMMPKHQFPHNNLRSIVQS